MPSFNYAHKEGNVALTNVGLHYLEWGETGPDVLIVHGITGMAIRWERFARTLMADFHIFAVDLRGHGHSSWAGAYALDDYADDLGEFIERAGLKNPVLIGHSLGGAIGMRFLGTRKNSIERFVCVDMGPELPRETAGRRRERPREPISWKNAAEALAYVKGILPAPESEDAEEYLFNHHKWINGGEMAARYDPAIFAPLRDGDGSPWSLWEEVRRIRIPTLILRGGNSRTLTREIADRMVREMPDARLEELAGTNHVLNVEDPDGFSRVVGDFVRSQEPS